MPDTLHRGFRELEGLSLPDRYSIRRPIATGGMASVWSAHDRRLGRNVAIKLISAAYARDHAAVRRFNREARAAARLSSHRHVVTIYDVGWAIDRNSPQRRPFIVMEHLAGGTAADALRVGEVSTDDALRWVEQAAAAVDYAHDHGVIHRDIKPANLLLDCERIAYVADFGIAQIGTEDTFGRTGQMLGTAAYTAPEQVLGRPATEASDRYALAVAAFELLIGTRPFTAEQFAAQARQHLEEEPPSASSRNPDLPPAVDGVLARGMAKRPDDRWATATEFASALTDAVSAPARRGAAPGPSEAVLYPAAVTLGPATRRTPPRRAFALGALAAGALGVGVAVAASDSSAPTAARLAATPGHAAATPAQRGVPAQPTRRPRPAPPTTSTTTIATTSAQAAPASATTPPPTALTLQAHGHELMVAGDYGAAIGALRQALSTASPGSITYAYALYDLGRSLRLAGDPRAAVPVLAQRLKIPNQTETVRLELQLALQEIGAKARSAPAPHRGPSAAHAPGNRGAGPGRSHRGHDHVGGPGHDRTGPSRSD